MSGVLSTMARSRAWRKFRRNRWALVASGVVLVYIAMGLYAALGDVFPGGAGISLAEAQEPVAPTRLPGSFVPLSREKRAELCRLYLEDFRKAFRSGAEDLADIHYAELRVADKPLEELKADAEEARKVYDSLANIPDLDADASSEPKVAELEKATAKLFRPLSGVARFTHALRLSLGTDRQGQSLLVHAVYSVKVALLVGGVVATASVIIGTLLGAAAAFFGGWVDAAVVWLYTTLSSMPELVLLAVLVYAFSGSAFDKASRPYLALVPLFLAMIMDFWIGPARIVRGEVIKIKELEYVQAVRAIGFSRFYVLMRHVVPNTVHLMFINFSLLFIAAIKYEVVLSFLGLGVKVGPSWGRMIQDSVPDVINGIYWQIGVATAFLFVLVLAVNVLSDALQDAFDPKHVD